MSLHEALFPAFLKQRGVPECEREVRFAPPRKWRFDYAWPEVKIALELEGGVWIRGRHTRPSGFLKDMEKYNAAATLGWLVLRTTPDKLLTAETIDMLKKAIQTREAA